MNKRLNGKICVWCVNKNREACLTRCQEEGQYRYLDPEPLADWELPPELPPFRELLELPAVERLALIYLSAYYRETH